MWPPTEMPATANVKTRLMTTSPSTWPPVAMGRRRSSTSSAPKAPKIAPDAPTVTALKSRSSAPAEPAIPATR